MIIRKKSSHPTISLVFGEAQQVLPSQSAAEKLPQILRKASPTALPLMSKAQSENSLEETLLSAPSNQPEPANVHEAGQVSATDVQDYIPLAAEGIPLPHLIAFTFLNVLYYFQDHILFLRILVRVTSRMFSHVYPRHLQILQYLLQLILLLSPFLVICPLQPCLTSLLGSPRGPELKEKESLILASRKPNARPLYRHLRRALPCP
jgi:hypothetical protein